MVCCGTLLEEGYVHLIDFVRLLCTEIVYINCDGVSRI